MSASVRLLLPLLWVLWVLQLNSCTSQPLDQRLRDVTFLPSDLPARNEGLKNALCRLIHIFSLHHHQLPLAGPPDMTTVGKHAEFMTIRATKSFLEGQGTIRVTAMPKNANKWSAISSCTNEQSAWACLFGSLGMKSSLHLDHTNGGTMDKPGNESHAHSPPSPRGLCGSFTAADMQRAAEVLQGKKDEDTLILAGAVSRAIMPSIYHKEALVKHVVNVPSETNLNISIHGRFADACNYMTDQPRPYGPVFWADPAHRGRPCFEFRVWMRELEIMAERYKTRNVIIATDSNAFLDFLLQNKSYNYYYVEYDRTKYESSQWIEARTDLTAEVVDMSLTDMWLLRDGHAFIGGLCSHYARAVFYLITGQLGYLPAFSSLDACGIVWKEWESMTVATSFKLGPGPYDAHWPQRRAVRAVSDARKLLSVLSG